MNAILRRALILAGIAWLGLQFYSPGDSHTFDVLLYIVIVLTNIAVLIHMFWDRKLSIWGSGSVAILFGAAGWAALFGWFFFRTLHPLDPGLSEGWLDVVRVLIAISGPLLIYALIRFRLEKLDRGEPAHPGELLTEGLHDRRRAVRRKEDQDRLNRIEELEQQIAQGGQP